MTSNDLIAYKGKTVDEVFEKLLTQEKELKEKQDKLEQFIASHMNRYFKVVHNDSGASYYHITDTRLYGRCISVYNSRYTIEGSRLNYLWLYNPEVGLKSVSPKVTEISKELFEEVQDVAQSFTKYLQ